jgi:ABC-2 type transport system ATP-binding protein
MEYVLEADGLQKIYGSTVAVDTVSFTVKRGEIVGLLGPNGAGKTTIINMVLGILSPTAGVLRMIGLDTREHRARVLGCMNFAAVYAQLPGNLTVYQNLHVFAHLYGIKNPRAKIEELLDRFDIGKYRATKCGVLSSGEQTRVSLAKALLNNPCLLLLDEPTASLDPSIASTIRDLLVEHTRACGCGVLWTSHNMHEVTTVCDRVLFLSHGKILLAGDPKILPAQYKKKTLEELFIAVAREPLSLGV